MSKHTLTKIKYVPKVGALDANGSVHFEVDITNETVSLYQTAYNASNGLIERVSDSEPIFTYNYSTTQFTDNVRDILLAIPQDE